MKKNLVRKGIVLGIIILFVGASIASTIGADINRLYVDLGPQLTWRFTDPQIVPGTPDKLIFDVEIKCDVPGTFHRDLQIYFNYNTDAFGDSIVTNGKISISDLYLMNDQPYYYYVNYPGSDNSPSRYSLLTANSKEGYMVGSPTYFTEVPTSWAGFVRFQIEITDATELAGIFFGETQMNTGQYYQNTSVPAPESYANPSLYENDLLNEPLVGGINMYVDDDRHLSWYDATHVRTIQEGIDNASSGSTIYVFEGMYIENIEVDTSVILIGENRENTLVVSASSDDDVFHITADDVTIRDFTIKGDVSTNAISHCTAEKYYESSIKKTFDAVNGVSVSSSTNCLIVNNSIIDNTYGVVLSGSSNNLIYNNYFDNDYNAFDTGMNQWNITKTPGINIYGGSYLGGNFWSDYAGADADGDGLGDTLLPYTSEGGIQNGGDYHPLVEVNLQPYTPGNPYPEDGVTGVPLDAVLSWTGGDPDGDPVTYDVYFGSSSPPVKVVSNQSATTYVPGTMNYDTIYYWQIVAWDDQGALTNGPEWSFTTEEELNNPPYVPSDPDPGDGETDVTTNADLFWTGGDPDVGDTVTYDVYFGTTSSPPQVVTGQSGTTYDPGTLEYNTQYYWKIVSWDNHGAFTEGPEWDFTTEAMSNEPPFAPTITGPTTGDAGTEYDYEFVVVDPEGDDVFFYIDWGDGSYEEWIGPYESNEEVTVSHIWEEQGIYTIMAQAKDVWGAVGEWGYLEVEMPVNQHSVSFQVNNQDKNDVWLQNAGSGFQVPS
jgi:parallel beta-helix repeat protein